MILKIAPYLDAKNEAKWLFLSFLYPYCKLIAEVTKVMASYLPFAEQE
jgi:hypothetical protein